MEKKKNPQPGGKGGFFRLGSCRSRADARMQQPRSARQSHADEHGDTPGCLGHEAGDAVILMAAAMPFSHARALAGLCPLPSQGRYVEGKRQARGEGQTRVPAACSSRDGPGMSS